MWRPFSGPSPRCGAGLLRLGPCTAAGPGANAIAQAGRFSPQRRRNCRQWGPLTPVNGQTEVDHEGGRVEARDEQRRRSTSGSGHEHGHESRGAQREAEKRKGDTTWRTGAQRGSSSYAMFAAGSACPRGNSDRLQKPSRQNSREMIAAAAELLRRGDWEGAEGVLWDLAQMEESLKWEREGVGQEGGGGERDEEEVEEAEKGAGGAGAAEGLVQDFRLEVSAALGVGIGKGSKRGRGMTVQWKSVLTGGWLGGGVEEDNDNRQGGDEEKAEEEGEEYGEGLKEEQEDTSREEEREEEEGFVAGRTEEKAQEDMKEPKVDSSAGVLLRNQSDEMARSNGFLPASVVLGILRALGNPRQHCTQNAVAATGSSGSKGLSRLRMQHCCSRRQHSDGLPSARPSAQRREPAGDAHMQPHVEAAVTICRSFLLGFPLDLGNSIGGADAEHPQEAWTEGQMRPAGANPLRCSGCAFLSVSCKNDPPECGTKCRDRPKSSGDATNVRAVGPDAVPKGGRGFLLSCNHDQVKALLLLCRLLAVAGQPGKAWPLLRVLLEAQSMPGGPLDIPEGAPATSAGALPDSPSDSPLGALVGCNDISGTGALTSGSSSSQITSTEDLHNSRRCADPPAVAQPNYSEVGHAEGTKGMGLRSSEGIEEPGMRFGRGLVWAKQQQQEQTAAAQARSGLPGVGGCQQPTPEQPSPGWPPHMLCRSFPPIEAFFELLSVPESVWGLSLPSFACAPQVVGAEKAVLESFARLGQLDKMEEACREMLAVGRSGPHSRQNGAAFGNTMLEAYLVHRQWAKAEELLGIMASQKEQQTHGADHLRPEKYDDRHPPSAGGHVAAVGANRPRDSQRSTSPWGHWANAGPPAPKCEDPPSQAPGPKGRDFLLPAPTSNCGGLGQELSAAAAASGAHHPMLNLSAAAADGADPHTPDPHPVAAAPGAGLPLEFWNIGGCANHLTLNLVASALGLKGALHQALQRGQGAPQAAQPALDNPRGFLVEERLRDHRRKKARGKKGANFKGMRWESVQGIQSACPIMDVTPQGDAEGSESSARTRRLHSITMHPASGLNSAAHTPSSSWQTGSAAIGPACAPSTSQSTAQLLCGVLADLQQLLLGRQGGGARLAGLMLALAQEVARDSIGLRDRTQGCWDLKPGAQHSQHPPSDGDEVRLSASPVKADAVTRGPGAPYDGFVVPLLNFERSSYQQSRDGDAHGAAKGKSSSPECFGLYKSEPAKFEPWEWHLDLHGLHSAPASLVLLLAFHDLTQLVGPLGHSLEQKSRNSWTALTSSQTPRALDPRGPSQDLGDFSQQDTREPLRKGLPDLSSRNAGSLKECAQAMPAAPHSRGGSLPPLPLNGVVGLVGDSMYSQGLCMPSQLCIVTGWGRHSRKKGKSNVKTAVLDVLHSLHAPFRVNVHNPGSLVASGIEVTRWLSSPQD